MARLGRNGFVAIAVVFHLIYIYSIFDIYFVSPIVSGMRIFDVETPAPAKRLVLMVGDGLRADKAFQSFPDPSPEAVENPDADKPRPLAPFLRSRVLHHGTFGVSHTRVPTESRPGHVALIAGLYEDVSAVTTGWTLNPVNFDSVFNRSRHTYSWGSPDILPMFQEGAVPGRVDAYCYESEKEDFTKDATALDIWVFDKVKAMFKEAETNLTLYKELHEDKTVFFLHLLGLDTVGHSERPYSKAYLHNIQVVDRGVEEITELIENFYGDDQTAFVFTADHGMSDWGSHGDGHPDNTRTPLIAWGSGVAKPNHTSMLPAPGHEDGFSSDWGFDHVQRHDVAQADIAALMAYLAGLPFPVNSVGELPLSYLNADKATKAKSISTNAKAILEMYRVKEEQRKATAIRFKPYGALVGKKSTPAARLQEIESLIVDRNFDLAIKRSSELMKITLEGLRYLQTYDWLFLRTLITAGYLGWIAFALTTVIDLHVLQGKTEDTRTLGSLMGFSSVFVVLSSVLLFQKSSWTYYAYAIFPVVFWEEVYARRDALIQGRKILFGNVTNRFQLAAQTVGFIGLLLVLVQSYFSREFFTLIYFAIMPWPCVYGGEFLGENYLLWITWATCCLGMSFFTLLPAMKTESLMYIMIAGFFMLVIGVSYLVNEKQLVKKQKSKDGILPSDSWSRTLVGCQVGLVALAMYVTQSSVLSLQAKEGLPLGTQVVGWVVLIASLAMPLLHSWQPNPNHFHRLMVIFLAFAPSFIILTISYEGLFYVNFCATLAVWVEMEHQLYVYFLDESTSQQKAKQPSQANGTSQKANGKAESSPVVEHSPLKPALVAANERLTALKKGDYRNLTMADARIALFFLFLLQSAFFSTGNVASISSFSLDAVKRLIPVFDPFSQGALLMLKILMPFAVISANLGILNRRLGVAPSALFMIVMAISDVMTLNFFYMVKDEGSWLDIGTTISHFCIASGLCVFVAGLEFLSEWLVKGVEFDDEEDIAREKAERIRRREEERIAEASQPQRPQDRRKGVIWGGMKDPVYLDE